MLIEHMAKGFSYKSFAGLIGVGRTTLYDWESKDEKTNKPLHPEWGEAKEIATAKNLLYWETMGISMAAGMKKKKESAEDAYHAPSPAVWIFNMVNRHGYRNRYEVGGPPSGAGAKGGSDDMGPVKLIVEDWSKPKEREDGSGNQSEAEFSSEDEDKESAA